MCVVPAGGRVPCNTCPFFLRAGFDALSDQSNPLLRHSELGHLSRLGAVHVSRIGQRGSEQSVHVEIRRVEKGARAWIVEGLACGVHQLWLRAVSSPERCHQLAVEIDQSYFPLYFELSETCPFQGDEHYHDLTLFRRRRRAEPMRSGCRRRRLVSRHRHRLASNAIIQHGRT